MSFAYLFPSTLFQMLPSENVNHNNSQFHEVKHDIVEVRNEIAQVKGDIADVRKDLEVNAREVEKLITSLAEKLGVVLAKPSEK